MQVAQYFSQSHIFTNLSDYGVSIILQYCYFRHARIPTAATKIPIISNNAGRRYSTSNARTESSHTVPRVANKIPTEKALKAPPPYCSGLIARIPERIIIQKPKRIKVSENTSDMSTRILVTKAVADTAKTTIKMPSERTPTGLFGIKPHDLLFSMVWL